MVEVHGVGPVYLMVSERKTERGRGQVPTSLSEVWSQWPNLLPLGPTSQQHHRVVTNALTHEPMGTLQIHTTARWCTGLHDLCLACLTNVSASLLPSNELCLDHTCLKAEAPSSLLSILGHTVFFRECCWPQTSYISYVTIYKLNIFFLKNSLIGKLLEGKDKVCFVQHRI